jgi:RNA polymerase sigma-B factor
MASERERAHEQVLLARYHDHGDLRAREELVVRLLPFARKLAARYAWTTGSYDDLSQVAALALLKAVDRYDPGRGVRFTSFAAPTILGELKRYFRDNGWVVHVSRDLQELSLKVTDERERLAKQLGRSPTSVELAEALGSSAERIVEADQVVATARDTRSLDAPVAADDTEGSSLADRLGADDRGYDAADERVLVRQGWERLSDVQRDVLRLRLVDDLTQSQVATRIGCSQMQVSRLIRKAITTLATGETRQVA